MIWFTADHHYGHRNILKYTDRASKMADVVEMDTLLISRWNEKVKEDDTVYHLGDFTLNGGVFFDAVVKKLNFRKLYIIPGGHDRWIYQYTKSDRIEIMPPLVTVQLEFKLFILCHYPMLEWDRKHYGSYHLHAHSHGKQPYRYHVMDVGVDCTDYYPVSYFDIVKRFSDESAGSRPEVAKSNLSIQP